MVDVICHHGCRNISRIIRHPQQMLSNFSTNAAVNSLSTSSSNSNICSLVYQLFPPKISNWFHVSFVRVRIWWAHKKKKKMAWKFFPQWGRKWTGGQGTSSNPHIFIRAALLCLSTQSSGHREGQSLCVEKLPRLETWGSEAVRT